MSDEPILLNETFVVGDTTPPVKPRGTPWFLWFIIGFYFATNLSSLDQILGFKVSLLAYFIISGVAFLYIIDRLLPDKPRRKQ